MPHQVLQRHKRKGAANMLPDIWHHGCRRHHLVRLSVPCIGESIVTTHFAVVKVPSNFHCSLHSFVQKDISCECVTIPAAQHAYGHYYSYKTGPRRVWSFTPAADVSVGRGDILELLLSLIKQWWLLSFHPVPFSVIFVQRTCLASPGKEVFLSLHTRVCLSST